MPTGMPTHGITNKKTIPMTMRAIPTPIMTLFSPAGRPRNRDFFRGLPADYTRPMTDALIVDAVRSPIGRKNGSLSVIRGDELSAQVVNGLVERQGLDPGEIEDVQWGCVSQVDEQAFNIGRNVALTAGWPVSVCGTTVDRQCGSSMQTNFNAAAAVWSGQLDLVLSGGVEMMSRVPMGSNNGTFSPEMHDRFELVPQGTSAELIAQQWHLTRE